MTLALPIFIFELKNLVYIHCLKIKIDSGVFLYEIFENIPENILFKLF